MNNYDDGHNNKNTLNGKTISFDPNSDEAKEYFSKIEKERMKEINSDKNYKFILNDMYEFAKNDNFKVNPSIDGIFLILKEEQNDFDEIRNNFKERFNNNIIKHLEEKYGSEYEFILEYDGSNICLFDNTNNYVYYFYTKKKNKNDKDIKEYDKFFLTRIEISAKIKEGGKSGNEDLMNFMNFINNSHDPRLDDKLMTYNSKYKFKTNNENKSIPKSFNYYYIPIGICDDNILFGMSSGIFMSYILSKFEFINYGYDDYKEHYKCSSNPKDKNEAEKIFGGKIMKDPQNHNSYFLSNRNSDFMLCDILEELESNNFFAEADKNDKNASFKKEKSIINLQKKLKEYLRNNHYFEIIKDRNNISGKNDFELKKLSRENNISDKDYFNIFCEAIFDKIYSNFLDFFRVFFKVNEMIQENNKDNIKFINIQFIEYEDKTNEYNDILSKIKMNFPK